MHPGPIGSLQGLGRMCPGPIGSSQVLGRMCPGSIGSLLGHRFITVCGENVPRAHRFITVSGENLLRVHRFITVFGENVPRVHRSQVHRSFRPTGNVLGPSVPRQARRPAVLQDCR